MRSARYDEWPGCVKCRHLNRRTCRCAADPDRIPLPIASGEVDHMVPRPGDHGIEFKPIEEPAQAASGSLDAGVGNKPGTWSGPTACAFGTLDAARQRVDPAWARGSPARSGLLDRRIANEAPPEGPVGPGSHWAVRLPGSDGPRTAHQGGDPVNRGNWAVSDSRTMVASWPINCDLSV